MEKKFKNKYKIKSARLKGYDYSQNGMYFMTICTKDKEDFFGSVKNGKMVLNEIGKIADCYWREIPKHFPFVNLDIHGIMPNHIHGIIEIISNNSVETPKLGVSKMYKTCKPETPGSGVSTRMWKSGCLGVIINQYKRTCTIEIRKQPDPFTFSWQSRYYDRVIRNEQELNRIREYIFSNPQNWEEDKNNLENLSI